MMVERLCPGCGCALIQRPGEHDNNFAKRKTCAMPECVDRALFLTYEARRGMKLGSPPIELVSIDPFAGVVFKDDPRAVRNIGTPQRPSSESSVSIYGCSALWAAERGG